jgi:hypothetical protein
VAGEEADPRGGDLGRAAGRGWLGRIAVGRGAAGDPKRREVAAGDAREEAGGGVGVI